MSWEIREHSGPVTQNLSLVWSFLVIPMVYGRYVPSRICPSPRRYVLNLEQYVPNCLDDLSQIYSTSILLFNNEIQNQRLSTVITLIIYANVGPSAVVGAL